jgi:hypothetical protein
MLVMVEVMFIDTNVGGGRLSMSRVASAMGWMASRIGCQANKTALVVTIKI